MKITVVGTGYVGLVTGTCFAEMGNIVWCVDVDEKKIDMLNHGISPIYEPGLESMVINNKKSDRLHFTTDIHEAVQQCELCFIAVGTPMDEDGSADLHYVTTVAGQIAQAMTHPIIVVNKSTVPVGTADIVRQCMQEVLDSRCSSLTFDIVSNPEFLKEGTAINDCLYPSRILIGSDTDSVIAIMRELYTPFIRNTENFIIMDIKSAEMTKYAANAMLATRISYMNEIANICERVGADVNQVRRGIGSDPRIGYQFIYPGCGYGGSCFPKDIQALIRTSKDVGYDPEILQSVEAVNKRQKHVLMNKVIKRFGTDLTNKSFAIWGLSFKPDTDDMRDAASLTIIDELAKRNASVRVYDPQSMEAAASFYCKDYDIISYCSSKYDALDGVEAMLLLTEWKEFRSPDFNEMQLRMKNPIIFDGRNQYSSQRLKELGFEYYQIGVSDNQ